MIRKTSFCFQRIIPDAHNFIAKPFSPPLFLLSIESEVNELCMQTCECVNMLMSVVYYSVAELYSFKHWGARQRIKNSVHSSQTRVTCSFLSYITACPVCAKHAFTRKKLKRQNKQHFCRHILTSVVPEKK